MVRFRRPFVIRTIFLVSATERPPPVAELLHDLRTFQLHTSTTARSADEYADPDLVEERSFETTTAGGWFSKWFG